MQLRTLWGRSALVATLALICARADATVTQVDGTIIPKINDTNACGAAGGVDLQYCFDTLEAGNPLNAVKDASEVPQIFQPRLATPVAFKDLGEGAGYENSFGWYNVGDDVSTPAGREANLHPILGCTIPMMATGNATTHTGNPLYYKQNAEPGDSISVDFQSELNAGRYKGGFIAFYLITPQANPSANNDACGDFKNGTDGLSLFGYIYFTQKDLNNDGDFVHHLVYSSKVTANRFYFGFEDLFRGGDNDYEDMLISADGLTPPCVATTETCDGLDNDCDGLIDAADPDLSGVNTACTCNGVGITCDNGPRFGECLPGVTRCTAGAITCHGTGTASGEICDGKDNNCNNMIDDGAPPGTVGTCDGADADLCKEGNFVCSAGGTVCNDNTGNNIEICNAIDDDCDGQTNEGDPGGGAACGSAIGRCNPGVEHCVGGAIVCQGSTGPVAEICNGIDDDCDGVVDDMPTDVGTQCGATNIGACEYGTTICVSGALQCGGAVGPAPERCDGIDNDCNNMTDDNVVDDGQVCGNSIGECDPGAYVCIAGTLACVGGIGPTAETCDGKDNDCNSIVDDGTLPMVGETCGVGNGPCSAGTKQCISGAIQCVGGSSTGTETCNNVDDDCDGVIDDGDLCDGGTCDNGVCASPCVMSEFPCPSGKRCVNSFCVTDPCFNKNCPADADGNLQTCTEGQCVALCPTLSCPPDFVCRGTDGACVKDTCEYLPKCGPTELCVSSQCVPNPCSGVTCDDGKFCRDGACVGTCQGVSCGVGDVCRDGTCAPTGCENGCTGTEVCDPATKSCVPNLCEGPCPPTQTCDPVTGNCVADPCNGVVCPDNQVCTSGQCGVGTTGALVTTGGGGGCDASGSESGGSLAAIGVALGLVLLGRRRKALLLAAGIASSTLAACDVNKYCIGCENADGEDGGMGSGSGDGGINDDGSPVSCDPSAMFPETCNNTDDDCDGTVDEQFNLMTDARNCGACGNECNKPGAQTACVAGACTITACFPGFNDRNGDIGGYTSSDGCEYMCFQSNNGVEACDTLDNNCDGVADEGFDVSDDVDNCGQCQRECEFFQASPTCSNAMCSFNPTTDCNAGYVDADGMAADGCEYQCTKTNAGTESCDVKDNDCDGRIDETFDLLTDKNNCSRCGNVCAFPHTVPKCFMGMCTFDAATDCVANFYDINGNKTDGCEYACTKSNGGIEKCDGIDNDCDGVADDMPVDAGAACSSTGTPRGACVANGVLTCASGTLRCTGATEAVAETCNNVDDNCSGAVAGFPTGIDENVTKTCYTGLPATTNGVGACRGGTQTCGAGTFGACVGQVTPAASETCNGIDDDCDTRFDEKTGGGVLTQSCYSGTAGTAGVGTCVAGTQTCAFGAYGTCSGEVTPKTEICGDNLNTDCDANTDTAEGCKVVNAEVRIDEAVAGSQHSYDVQLARGGSPNGSRVYAVWSQLVSSGHTVVQLAKSINGGTSFASAVALTPSDSDAVKPMIVVVPGATQDRLIVAFQTVTGGVRDIKVITSPDSGASFGGQAAALDASGDSFHHAVAINGANVVVAWEQLDTATLNRDVYSATSTNSGASFTAAIKINASTGTRFAGRPQVGITSTNGVVWAWREQTSGKNTRDVYAAAVTTIAGAPASNVRVDNDTADKRDADFPRLVVNESNAYLTWQDVSTIATAPNNGSDVMFSRSTNGGAAWSGEVIIDDPAAEVSSSFTPVVDVDPRAAGTADDLVVLAWEDRRQGTQAYVRVSPDGGATFGTPVRTSNLLNDPQPGQTSVPVLAVSGSGVIAVAYQNKPVATMAVPFPKTHVFLATSIDNGASWTYSAKQLDAGTGDAQAPTIVASVISAAASAVVAWVDFRTDGIHGDIYTAAAH